MLGVRIMIVDDYPPVRRLLIDVLGAVPDITVVGEAGSGEEALDRLATLTPDVIVMDWSMPGIDGVTATARVKERHPGINVIAWTSTDDPAVVQRFREAGAAAVYVKEDVDALVDFIRHLLR